MTRPIISIFDVLTQTETVREMNDEEYAEYLAYQEKIQALEEANRPSLEG